ncbi:hypothetical protein [Coleofasciculus chthonoplastes]|uniref:hypothetical protein n=1 Tax=Coleofasciculus chthonoplastes TaxID=64178 RepID=UPI003303DA07
MSRITVSDLPLAGSDLFQGAETFLSDLTENDLSITAGLPFPIIRSIIVDTAPMGGEDLFFKSISYMA